MRPLVCAALLTLLAVGLPLAAQNNAEQRYKIDWDRQLTIKVHDDAARKGLYIDFTFQVRRLDNNQLVTDVSKDMIAVYEDGRKVLDLELTQPDWALGYRFDIVVAGAAATPFEPPGGATDGATHGAAPGIAEVLTTWRW